jgi:HAD superfamily hydrolase (TIGR01490 family)
MGTISSEKDNISKSYFAFFDLDRTITDSVSGKELALAACKGGLMKRYDLVSAVFLSLAHKMKLVDPSKAIIRMGEWVKGMNVEIMENLCADVFTEVLKPSVFPQVSNEIKLHRENQAGLVILSSTLAPIGRKMAEHLGMDDILCTELEAVEGQLTGRPRGNFCYGKEKLIRLKKYCEKNNSNLQDAWYYGDAFADLPALSIVGHPVCINPERKLEKIAKKKGWKIYYWKK